MSQFAGFYTRKDRTGRHYEAGYFPCCRRRSPAPCRFCEHCLIHVGPYHYEQALGRGLLPVLTDTFDEEEGQWYRGIVWQEADVCLTCLEEFELDRYQPTLRLLPLSADVRRARVEAWAAERGVPVPVRRHVGGFIYRTEE